jgi:hypothetical protein
MPIRIRPNDADPTCSGSGQKPEGLKAIKTENFLPGGLWPTLQQSSPCAALLLVSTFPLAAEQYEHSPLHLAKKKNFTNITDIYRKYQNKLGNYKTVNKHRFRQKMRPSRIVMQCFESF